VALVCEESVSVVTGGTRRLNQEKIKKLIPSSGGAKLRLSIEKIAPAEGPRGDSREGKPTWQT
jgi:hypothetical protein